MVRVEDRLVHKSYQTDMDPHAAAIEQNAIAITALQDTIHGLN